MTGTVWRRMALAVTLAGTLLAGAASAQERHGLSKFGDLKYPSDFKHFDYVNPTAPKGGRIALTSSFANTTYDNFNPWIVKGDAAHGYDLIYDSLMMRAYDEPDAMYGLVARSAEIAADKRSVIFRLRPEAKFADGSQITAADCVFTFNAFKDKGHPQFKLMLRDIVRAEALDPLTVKYTFEGDVLRDLPLIAAGLPVLPKAWWESRFGDVIKDPPLGSGPYKLSAFTIPRTVTYTRRPDYWAKDLPVNVGQNNFDTIRYEYFTERPIGLEQLKAGAFDLREEFTAKAWATEYDVPQVKDGRLKRLELPDGRPSGAQGWYLNMRKPKFQDVRVRRAIGLAFDFEWANKNLFFDQYTRTVSIFENSDMKASGLPSAEELKLLEPFRDKLPKEIFEAPPFSPPVSDGSGRDRKLLGEASRLLDEAGWTVKGGKRVNAAGETFTIEFLVAEESSVRILQPFIKGLELIGITGTIRRIDQAQYEERRKTFDYDVSGARLPILSTPGVELRNQLSSDAADNKGSFNLSGLKDPVVDALLDKVVNASSRAELLAATRALDRVLRSKHVWVPNWYKAKHTIAHWDRFGYPPNPPKYDVTTPGVPSTWWWDAEKAAKLP